MDPLYYFVAAAVIGSFGVGFATRKALEEIAVDFDKRAAVQTTFFIRVAIIEVIPILLIVMGFMNISSSNTDFLVPLIIVAVSAILNFLLIMRTPAMLTSFGETSPELSAALKTLAFMGAMLGTSFPIIALVAVFLTV